MTATRDSIVRLLQQSVEEGATELHFKVPAPPLLRRDGRLVPARLPALQPADVHGIVLHLSALARKELPLAAINDTEFALGLPGVGRFLVSVYRQRGSLAVCVRRVPTHPPTLADLGLGADVARLAGQSGLVLVSGSSRADLLHALVSEFNANDRGHVVVLESPLSYLHRDQAATVVQREVGVDVGSYEEGIRAALRCGADLLVIGELETTGAVDAALCAAERGLPVLAATAAPDAELATWWLTRMFLGEAREVVERRLELVRSCTVAFSGEAGQLLPGPRLLRRAV